MGSVGGDGFSDNFGRRAAVIAFDSSGRSGPRPTSGTDQIAAEICSKGSGRLFGHLEAGCPALPGTCGRRGWLRKGHLAIVFRIYVPSKSYIFLVNYELC